MPQWRDRLLGGEDRPADGAVAACRKAAFGAGGGDGLVRRRFVAGLAGGFLLFQNRPADGAVLPLRQARGGAGGGSGDPLGDILNDY